MKITGLILVVLGLLGGLFCVIQVVNETGNRDTATGAEANVRRPDMTIPILVSAGAIGVGGAMVFFGGRGYFVSNNPRVRN